MNIFLISMSIQPVAIILGLIIALMVWKKIMDRRVFISTGIVVILASIVLMVISINPILCIPILFLGVIHLLIGLTRVQMNLMRIIVIIIGILITQLAIWGALAWGMSGEHTLAYLSVVFFFIGAALSIGSLVWPAKR